MLPYFEVNEFTVGPFVLKAWGTFVSLGILAGIGAAYQNAKQKHLRAELLFDIIFWILLSGFIGARAVYVLEHFPFFIHRPGKIFELWTGGLSIYGGFAGALIGYTLFTRIRNIPFWRYADSLVFGLPLSISVGRVGCLLIHDHIGKPTSFLLGIEYVDKITRHETALYESIYALILFLVFCALLKNSAAQKERFYTSMFLIVYGVTRFFLDFLRADDLPVVDPRWWGELTTSQYISIVAILTGMVIAQRSEWFTRWSQEKRTP